MSIDRTHPGLLAASVSACKARAKEWASSEAIRVRPVPADGLSTLFTRRCGWLPLLRPSQSPWLYLTDD